MEFGGERSSAIKLVGCLEKGVDLPVSSDNKEGLRAKHIEGAERFEAVDKPTKVSGTRGMELDGERERH